MIFTYLLVFLSFIGGAKSINPYTYQGDIPFRMRDLYTMVQSYYLILIQLLSYQIVLDQKHVLLFFRKSFVLMAQFAGLLMYLVLIVVLLLQHQGLPKIYHSFDTRIYNIIFFSKDNNFIMESFTFVNALRKCYKKMGPTLRLH